MNAIRSLGKTCLSFGGMASVLLALANCDRGDREIKVYRVAKAPLEAPADDRGAEMKPPTGAEIPAGNGTASGRVPPNWQPQRLSQMRQASFLVTGKDGATADVSLVTLAGSAGNLLDNVNRWLGQLGQPPVNDDELRKLTQQISPNVILVDLQGLAPGADAKKDGRIVALVVSGERGTAFFKMRGNSELVAAEKEHFVNWATAPLESAPAGEAAPPDVPQIQWRLPAGWVAKPPSAMRYASFSAGNEVDVSVVTFPGEGGGDLDNVNRWRQQLGLPPADPAALNTSIKPLQAGDTTFSTTDLTSNSLRTVAAWTRRNGRSWFFKMTGPSAAVETEMSGFVSFLKSVKF